MNTTSAGGKKKKSTFTKVKEFVIWIKDIVMWVKDHKVYNLGKDYVTNGSKR